MTRARLALLICGLVLTAAAVADPGPALAGTRQRVTAQFSTRKPNTPVGLTVTAAYTDGNTPPGHAHALRHISDGLPLGTQIRTAAVPSCSASDLVLTLLGPAACPPASRVGSGVVDLNLGLLGALGLIRTDVTLINSRGQILFLGREPRTGIGLVDHGVLHGTAIEIDIAPIPGLPPEGAWVDDERFTIRADSGLLVTPASCPRGHHWTFRRGHTYGDGVTQVASIPLPCTPRRAPRRR